MDRRLQQTAESGLARLLARLDPDPERAGDAYERLRRTLIKFFDWRGAYPPDECADVALDRLARKLEQATDIGDVHSYAHGIARLVLFERLRRPAATSLEDAGELAAPDRTVGDQRESMRECLDRCLAALPGESRSVVLRYYEHKGEAKIVSRRELARELGISENALRSRIQRLRDRLESCVHKCMSSP